MIYRYIRPHLKAMSLGLVIKITGTIMDLFLPWILSYMIDTIVPVKNFNKIIEFGIIMIICSIIAVTGNVVANRMASRVARDCVYEIRNDLFTRISYMSCKQIDYYTIPTLVSRLSTDTYNVHQFIGRIQRLGVRAPILLIGGIILTLKLEPVLSLVMIATLPPLALVVFFISKRGITLYAKLQKSVDSLVKTVRETYSGIRVIKALSKTDIEREKFDNIVKDVVNNEKKAGITMAISNPVMSLCLNLGLTIVVLTGAYRVNMGYTMPGTIIAFMSYFTIILNAMLSITKMFTIASKGIASANRIDEILHLEPDIRVYSKEEYPDKESDYYIEFDNVSFSYLGKKDNISNLSFGIKYNETLGIIGNTGAGKSTILLLLLRFYDVDTVNASLSNDLLQIFTTVITVIFSFASMLYLSPMLLLAFVITIPMSIFFTRYKATQVKPFFSKRSAKLGELNGFVEEIISGQKTIKAYNKEDYTILRFDSKNKDAVDAYYDADYNGSVIGPSVNFINNISLSLISTLGAILYLYNMSTLGNISAFILYSRKFSGPINELANITSELQSAFAAAERIFNLLDEPEEISDVSDAIDIDAKGQVDFHNVCFSYDENVSVIDNLNLHVEPGELVAIVGPTGAGKTTIVNLLMRFYDTNSGKILLDGIDIHNITRKSLRKSFTMVLQDTWLFSGSIYDNLAYGNPSVTYEDVVKAAKIAGIDDYIESLPDGYNTILSDDGVNISKGQKQIQNAMYSLMQGRTCFVIAHRLSTIQNADKIVVINKGQISEQGTHDELMAKKGYYYTLYSSQFV